MAIGRISGSVLKSNLTRNGTDLAFETNLLYLDVTNSRIGIGTSEPTTTLHVNGDTNITGDLTGVTDITASGTTQTDIIKNREQRYTTSNMMKFNQLYTGASSGSYFSANEYQKVVTITPSGDSQNYQVIGRITAQNAGETHVVNFNAALRSNTLPDLNWSIFYDEDYNGSRYIDPQLWTKETTTAGFIFAFKTLATIYGTVTVDFDVIPRTSALLGNVSINTTQDSEQTSVDAGFTANDMTRVVRKQSSNVNINGAVTATSFVGDGSGLTNVPTSFGDLTAVGSTIISPSNADLTLDPAGTGRVVVNNELVVNTLSSDDSSAIRINENIDMAGNIVPVADNTYSLGTSTSKWSALHVAGSTIFLGNLQLKDTGSNSLTVLQSDGSTQANLEIANILTVVGDDSTGTSLNTGETFKFAGTQNITTAVSGDTLTITGPDLTSYATTAGSETLTNKTISLGSNTVSGTTAQFNSALSDGSFATLAGSETLTNKTLTTPVISSISNTGTLTLPTSTDTLVGRATTDTLTNKTLTSPTINGATMTGSVTVDNLTLNDNIISTSSNANLILDPGGTGTVDVSSAKITSVGTPTADADAATKAYVDTQVSSVSTSSITEGNTNVTVADSGTGSVTITADGNTELVVNDTNATFSGPVVIKGRNTIILNDTDDSNYIALRAPATVTTNATHTLPDGYGTSGQVLSTDGAGVLSWADAGGGGGGGSSFPNSTITTAPGTSGNYDLAEGPAQDGDETPFEAGGTDAFGVNLGTVFDSMDPVGTTNTLDYGDGEAYVGA